MEREANRRKRQRFICAGIWDTKSILKMVLGMGGVSVSWWDSTSWCSTTKTLEGWRILGSRRGCTKNPKRANWIVSLLYRRCLFWVGAGAGGGGVL